MKAVKTIVKILVVLVVLVGLGYGGYLFYESRQTADAGASAVAYSKVTIGTGTLTKSVTGTGSLAIRETADVSVDYPVVISKALVQSGESVHTGDPIAQVDTDALKSAIITMNTELTELDASIAQLAAAYTGTSTITPSAAGRVKQIYASAGDMTATIMNEYGGLMLLSGDGYMKVNVDSGSLALNDSVKVRSGVKNYTGTVSAVEEGRATVLFADDTTLPGETVTVLKGTTQIGEGKAEINMPVMVSTSVDGYVDKVYVSVNSSVTRRTSLLYVTHIPADTEYDDLVHQREEKLAAIAAARETLISGVILSDADGIVSAFQSASQTELEAGTGLATVYVGDAMEMTISVDELDIISVKLGQKVSIAMDAVTDKTYDATVSYISQIGTPSSGVTNYSVTLSVEGDDQLKIGMNGTATIVVEEVTDAVLVPLTAVSTGRNGSYVLKDNGESATEGIPGEQVFIQTGLSNENYAQVLSGLSAGDVVLVTRTAASGSSGNEKNGMNMGGMDFGSMPAGGMDFGSMPSGGGMPSGERPFGSGGGQGRQPSGN